MTQKTVTEIDMDVFTKCMNPYLSWLETKIEGWVIDEDECKAVFRATKKLSEEMRARFVLGVSEEEFGDEIERIVQLMDSASDAFPDYSDEIDVKKSHFFKGIGSELGVQFLPTKYEVPKPDKPTPEPTPEPMPEPSPQPEPSPEPEPEPTPKPEPARPPAEKKVKKRVTKTKKTVKKAETEVQQEEKPKKNNRIVKFFRDIIFGED